MFSTIPDYSVGDIIAYTPFGGGTRHVKVTYRDPDIKNGQPGFDGNLVDQTTGALLQGIGTSVWGYDRQITTVILSLLKEKS